MGSWRDNIGLGPVVRTRATAGKINDVVCIIRPGVSHSAAVCATKCLDIFRCTDRDHILRRSRRPHGFGSGSGVPGRKHKGHLLVTRSDHGRSGRLRVADQSVIILRIHIVSPRRVGSPGIAADASSVTVGPCRQIVIGRTGEAAGVKNDRSPQLHKRTYPHSKMETGRIHMRERGQIHLPSNDMGVEISVSVLRLRCTSRIRRPLQPVVHHPGGAAVQNGTILV